MGRRKHPDRATERDVLLKCRRRCCLCFYLSHNETERAGQIAHLDHDPSNSTFDNLAWLCLEHHDKYDSRTSQSKGLTEAEVRTYRDKLYQHFESSHGNGQDIPRLRVAVSPRRIGNLVGAHLEVENTSPRPARLVAWYCKVGVGEFPAFSVSAHSALPRVLFEREVFSFTVEMNTTDPDEVREVGVEDSDGTRWAADRILQFAQMAERDRKTKHLLPPADNGGIPENCVGQSISFTANSKASAVRDHLQLVLCLTNLGSERLPILGARLAWQYSPPRVVANTASDSKATVAELGGSITISVTDRWLPAGRSVEYCVDHPWTSMLIDAAASDVDRKSLCLDIVTSKTAGWKCAEDGLPEAVDKVARSVIATRR